MVIAFGAISGLYGGCIKTSQTSSQGFWRVTTDMCPGAVLMEHNTSSAGQFWTFLVNRWLQMVQLLTVEI
ncbi:hypothetical protein TNCV_4964871 [Trichonephila clavipes]|nr:hypothetical protein TNCV_4964871 [Trichonephila clavipes]